MQVAILCNHQRAVPAGHTGQMEKMSGKLMDAQAELDDLQAELKAARRGDTKWRSRSRLVPIKERKDEDGGKKKGKAGDEEGEAKLKEVGIKPARSEDRCGDVVAAAPHPCWLVSPSLRAWTCLALCVVPLSP